MLDELFRVDCFHRANISACSAIGAFVGIYFVDITFRNRLNGTFVDAGAACGAIFIDFISHDLTVCACKTGWVNNSDFHCKYTIF
jgi:hypothetical protein